MSSPADVLLVTGACGVGKTTLARAWAEARHGAVIECDYLTEWIHNPDFPHWTEQEERFVAGLAAMMAREYLDFGMPVAIENVWTPLGLDVIREKLMIGHPDLQVRSVWLRCARPENHRRDRERGPDNQMRERVDIVNDELAGYAWPDDLQIIDTTELSVTETVERINSWR